MRERGLRQTANYRDSERHGARPDPGPADRHEAPRPARLCFDIAVAVAGFLAVAVVAQLVARLMGAG